MSFPLGIGFRFLTWKLLASFLSVTRVLLTRANFSGTAEATQKMLAFKKTACVSAILLRGIGHGVFLCPIHRAASSDLR